jgi:hypothetical protein
VTCFDVYVCVHVNAMYVELSGDIYCVEDLRRAYWCVRCVVGALAEFVCAMHVRCVSKV